MRDKLEQLIRNYEALEQKLYDPAVVSDPKEYARLAKERSNQMPLANTWALSMTSTLPAS